MTDPEAVASQWRPIADLIREGLEFPPGTDEYDRAVELMALRSAKWRQKNVEDKGADGFGDNHWEDVSDDAYRSEKDSE